MEMNFQKIVGEIKTSTEWQLRLMALHSMLGVERLILTEYMQSGKADIDYPDQVDKDQLNYQLLCLVELHNVVFTRIQRFSGFARAVAGEATAAGSH